MIASVPGPRSHALPRELFGSKALGHNCDFIPGSPNIPANTGILSVWFITRVVSA